MEGPCWCHWAWGKITPRSGKKISAWDGMWVWARRVLRDWPTPPPWVDHYGVCGRFANLMKSERNAQRLDMPPPGRLSRHVPGTLGSRKTTGHQYSLTSSNCNNIRDLRNHTKSRNAIYCVYLSTGCGREVIGRLPMWRSGASSAHISPTLLPPLT